jgi:hypothetical protein
MYGCRHGRAVQFHGQWQAGATGPEIIDMAHTPDPRVDAFAIATDLIKRGFPISFVNPNTKQGVTGWKRRWRPGANGKSNNGTLCLSLLALKHVLQEHPEFAHYNVSVIGYCRTRDDHEGLPVGELLILDIDGEGVLEQILAENPGNGWPSGYTVCSRPNTKPYKKHYYFRHTPHSIAMFKALGIELSVTGRKERRAVEVSAIRDLTRPKVDGLHPNRYDLKGSGDGGFVVAAGSVHASGEMYKCINDGPVPDLPDWLVNWFCDDIRKYRFEDRQRRKAEEANVLKSEASESIPESTPESEQVEVDRRRRRLLLSRAGSLASLGVRRKSIQRVLRELAEDYTECPGGADYAKSKKGLATFHKIAHDPTLVIHRVRLPNETLPRPKQPQAKDGLIVREPAISVTRHEREQAVVSVIQQFTAPLPSTEALSRIKQECLKLGFTIDERKDKALICRARDRAGWEATAGRYGKWAPRTASMSNVPSSYLMVEDVGS